jgi:hypothetical protein
LDEDARTGVRFGDFGVKVDVSISYLGQKLQYYFRNSVKTFQAKLG